MHATRSKISATLAPETQEYLKRLVKSGRAASVSEAIDQAVSEARRAYSIRLLEHDTAAYFESLTGKVAAEESRLDSDISRAAHEINFDE